MFTGTMDSVIYQGIIEKNLIPFAEKKFPNGFRIYQVIQFYKTIANFFNVKPFSTCIISFLNFTTLLWKKNIFYAIYFRIMTANMCQNQQRSGCTRRISWTRSWKHQLHHQTLTQLKTCGLLWNYISQRLWNQRRRKNLLLGSEISGMAFPLMAARNSSTIFTRWSQQLFWTVGNSQGIRCAVLHMIMNLSEHVHQERILCFDKDTAGILN